jgi:poly(A) polymerase
LLLLRGEAEAGNTAKIAQWWKEFVEADETDRSDIANSVKGSNSRNRNAPQRKRRRKPAAKPAEE